MPGEESVASIKAKIEEYHEAGGETNLITRDEVVRKIRLEKNPYRGMGKDVLGVPAPYHTYENPLLPRVIDKFSAPPAFSGDITERLGKAAVMGVGAGAMFHLCYFPWHYVDPVEINGTKSNAVIRSQWGNFFRGFGKPMFWFTASSVIFTGVESLMDDFSGHHSYSHTGVAGFAAGFAVASITKRLDTMFLTGTVLGSFMAMVDYNGLSAVSDAKTQAMKIAGKRPMRHEESKELSGLKEKYPEYADL